MAERASQVPPDDAVPSGAAAVPRDDQPAWMAAIVQGLADAVVGLSPDGTIVTWNPAAERLFAAAAATMIGRSVERLAPPGTADGIRPLLARTARGETVRDHPVRLCRQDGGPLDVSVTLVPLRAASGQPFGGAMVVRAIRGEPTAGAGPIRSQAEQEAITHRRAAKLQGIVDSMVDSVWAVNADGSISLANPASLAMAGLTHLPADGSLRLDDIMRRLVPRYLTGAAIPTAALPLIRSLQGETCTLEDQLCHDAGRGWDVTVRVSSAPVRDEAGQVVAAVAVVRDVTELAELDRLKDEFIRLVAHEIKTPVAIMKGYAQLIDRQATALPQRQRTMLEAIDRSADRIDRLVQNLLDVWNLRFGNLDVVLEPLDLVALVHDVVARRSDLAEIHPVRTQGPPSARVIGDPVRLGRIVESMIDHTVSHLPRGGEILASIRQDAETVWLVVGLARAFEREPLVKSCPQAEEAIGGLGTSLYLAREIVSLHEGSLTVLADGDAPVIQLRLPRAEGATP